MKRVILMAFLGITQFISAQVVKNVGDFSYRKGIRPDKCYPGKR